MSRVRAYGWASALILSLLGACAADGRRGGVPSGGDAGGDVDAGMLAGDTGVVDMDAGTVDVGTVDPDPVDPFDPDAACGSSAIETEQVPGSLLLVFDRSGSMDDPPGGSMASGPSKWSLAGDAIRNTLSSANDQLSVGLMFFPGGDECSATIGAPAVPVEPLMMSRPMIDQALTNEDPTGAVTPIFDALRTGWDYLDTLTTPGQRGLVLVTDGAENCGLAEQEQVFQQAADELATNNYLTFVVGLTQSDSVLSNIAHSGGTPRDPTCNPDCTANLCYTPAECIGNAPCIGATNFLGIPIPGFCSCENDSHCPTGQSCTSPIPGLIPNECTGPSSCCHYDATAGNFQADFQAALEEIARRFLDSCVFEVPREDGAAFDPNFVNVSVTFEGEDRTVLGRSDDETVDSWNYTTPENESIIIQGPVCDELRSADATVEIVVGCPTILI